MRSDRKGSRPCENSRTFSHGPISFAFSSPETVQRRRNHGNLRSAPPVAKFRGVLTPPRSICRVRHAAGNDGVDGAPNGISVPRWSLSKPICREAVHGQVYPEFVDCHAGWSRSGEEGGSGSRSRGEGRDRCGAQTHARPAPMESSRGRPSPPVHVLRGRPNRSGRRMPRQRCSDPMASCSLPGVHHGSDYDAVRRRETPAHRGAG